MHMHMHMHRTHATLMHAMTMHMTYYVKIDFIIHSHSSTGYHLCDRPILTERADLVAHGFWWAHQPPDTVVNPFDVMTIGVGAGDGMGVGAAVCSLQHTQMHDLAALSQLHLWASPLS